MGQREKPGKTGFFILDKHQTVTIYASTTFPVVSFGFYRPNNQ